VIDNPPLLSVPSRSLDSATSKRSRSHHDSIQHLPPNPAKSLNRSNNPTITSVAASRTPTS
jgi:hypothetical protein